MARRYVSLGSVLVFSITLSAAFAAVPNSARFRHADKNKDGVVDRKEMKMEKRWEHRQRSKVNTPAEKLYDSNHDGWLEPSEARQLLKDKYTIIKTDGKAKVDTPVEAQFDTNKDGVIDAAEAKSLLEYIN